MNIFTCFKWIPATVIAETLLINKTIQKYEDNQLLNLENLKKSLYMCCLIEPYGQIEMKASVTNRNGETVGITYVNNVSVILTAV